MKGNVKVEDKNNLLGFCCTDGVCGRKTSLPKDSSNAENGKTVRSNSGKTGEKQNIVCSACLVGEKCRYDGRSNENKALLGLAGKYNLIPVCPEVMGGLPTPREPSEIRDGRVVTKSGKDVTANFADGAEKALAAALENNCVAAVLKARSPSCGLGKIYDGTFQGVLTAGDGLFAALLKEKGVRIFTEENISPDDI